MIPRLPSVSKLSLNPITEQSQEEVQVTGRLGGHVVEQRTQASQHLPVAELHINPTSTPSAGAYDEVDEKKILEQQLTGILQETKIAGFELSLESVQISDMSKLPVDIEAHITCSTSYDNKDNVSEALERVHTAIEPILKDFVKQYSNGYKNAPGLSLEAQEEFKKRVQEIVTQCMPKGTPSIGGMLSFMQGKPVISLSPKFTQSKNTAMMRKELEKLMQRHNIPGIINTVFGEINVEEPIEPTDDKKIKKKPLDFHALRKGK